MLQASTLTYKRIEIAANSHPENIKGDGTDGMPVNPDGFVELSGFQGEEYSLDFCVDEQIPELKCILIFDSDPDGGEHIEETTVELKAI